MGCDSPRAREDQGKEYEFKLTIHAPHSDQVFTLKHTSTSERIPFRELIKHLFPSQIMFDFNANFITVNNRATSLSSFNNSVDWS